MVAKWLENGFNMGRLESKRPLILIVTQPGTGLIAFSMPQLC